MTGELLFLMAYCVFNLSLLRVHHYLLGEGKVCMFFKWSVPKKSLNAFPAGIEQERQG
jgi:hypothetical protein